MGQLGAYSNLSDAAVQEGMEVLPPGEYVVEVTDSDVYDKNGNTICKLEFSVDGKPNKIWEYLSFSQNQTKTGRTIAQISQDKLKTIAACGGHRNPNYIADTEELHGLRMIGRLKIEKDETGQYAPKNRITSFKFIDKNDNQPFKNHTAQKPETLDPPKQAVEQKMPWETSAKTNEDIPF